MTYLPKNHIIGSKIVEVPITSSTNTYAINLLTKSKPQEGTIIIATIQTEGKGQIGRKWYSSQGSSLTLSVIIYPAFVPIERQFILSIMVSLSVFQTLSMFCKQQIAIKWPNDLYIGSKKVGGILIQNNLYQKKIKSTVIGIGINLNNDSFPEDLPNATSVYLIEKEKVDINYFQNVLIQNLDFYYLELQNEKSQELINEYLDHLWGKDDILTFSTSLRGEFEGIIRGISSTGKLKLEINGQINLFSVGELNFIFK